MKVFIQDEGESVLKLMDTRETS